MVKDSCENICVRLAPLLLMYRSDFDDDDDSKLFRYVRLQFLVDQVIWIVFGC